MCPKPLDNHFMNKIAIAGLMLLAFAYISGCKPEETPAAKKPEQPVAVKLVQPRRGEITRSVALPATVAANQQATLYAKATGYLKKINVDKGDEVKEGDVLAEIEAPELIADLGKAKAEVETAKLESNRATEAQKKAPDLIVAQTIDTAKGKFEVAKANLERAETMLNFCKIVAPFSGTIIHRFVDPGAFIPAATASSASQSAALLTLADFKTVRVQVAVPESEVPRITKGLPVKIAIDELPGKDFQGTVSRFANALDEATKTMLAEIDLENSQGELRPGMYATAKVGVEKHRDVLLLPSEAVLIEKSGASVFTVAENKAKKTAIHIGFNDGASIEVLDGLKPEEPVIVLGKMTLNNGQAVTITGGK
jgi:membrane fusion protein (multidrug efflux system)